MESRRNEWVCALFAVAMVALMGGKSVLVGIRPSVAITATELGLTLGQALTALDVEQGIRLLSEASSLSVTT